MPTGYAGEGKTFLKSQGKWVKTKKEQAFDYDGISAEQARTYALIISFFRYYPDYWYDMIRSADAKYKLELPQRVLLRVFARYRNVYVTGCRGITKTYCIMLSKCHDGLFFPGEKVRYVAPAQKQSASLASNAFKTVCENYPLIDKWWNKNNDRQDMFRITTIYGSEFTMYAPRGDNSSAIVGEEMAQEGEGGFDIDAFESDISPTCRITRKIHGKDDRTHINLKEDYISNACSRQNRAFTVYRANALKDMAHGNKNEGFCLDMSWISALLCNLRDIAYFKREKKKLTAEKWLREMCARYIGTAENPIITDEVLARSKRLKVMEERHCGDYGAIYIVGHDVSYVDGRKNAKCSDVVLKLTRFNNQTKRDKYLKQVVYVDNYDPPNSEFSQAKRLKDLWSKYCIKDGEITPLVIDAQAYGTAIVNELHKPTVDGTKPLKTINNNPLFAAMEQPNAMPVIYALKAVRQGGTDSDSDMIQYAQSEFEHGNVELLTTNVLDGVEAYKTKNGIKDNFADSKIAIPYKNTELLCSQISNLKTEASGTGVKEKRRSQSIQRDIWSALKYALKMAKLLEDELAREQNRAKSSWQAEIEKYISQQGGGYAGGVNGGSDRARLLSLRKR